MIPLRDINPRHTLPVVNVALIAVNVLVFFYTLTLHPLAGERLVATYGMVPARLGLALTHPAVSVADAAVPLVSSMFLHGGLWHILGNMWFLWVFGDNIEDRLGHLRYLAFYLLCGVGAGLAHALVDLNSTVPAIGASGAVSGVMGAYLVLFPHSRVVTLVPLVVFFFTVRLPAVVILGYWFLVQFLSGVTALGPVGSQGVAWWAHIGGFLLGMGLTRLFVPRRKYVF